MTMALIASILLADAGPFNIQGRFVDLAPEATEWAMPSDGAQFDLTLSSSQLEDKESTWKIKAGEASGTIIGSFRYSKGKIEGNARFENGSGNFAGVRFDIAGAIETYNAKDKDGNPIQLTRRLSIREDSPILFGDMMDSEKTESYAISASDIAWKPETIKIDVTFQLSGFVFSRAMFSDHPNSSLAFDHKGRLLVGSAQQQAIYRANLKTAELEVVSSTPDFKAIPSVNPVDGTIVYSNMNGHEFRLLSAGGSEKGTIEQVEDVTGMVGWPSYSAFDGKGRLYVMFGHSVAMMNGDRPAFVLTEAGGFQFQEYSRLAVAKDGTIFVGSGSNVFRFAEGGKSPRKIAQGPDWRPGRLHGTNALAYDDATGAVWVGSNTEDEFIGRVDSFDRDGKFLFCLGRGGAKVPEANSFWPGQCPFPCSIAISTEGNLYVANYEGSHSVMEFLPIRRNASIKE